MNTISDDPKVRFRYRIAFAMSLILFGIVVFQAVATYLAPKSDANRAAVTVAGEPYCPPGSKTYSADLTVTSNEQEKMTVIDSTPDIFLGKTLNGPGTIDATLTGLAPGSKTLVKILAEFTPPVPAEPAGTYEERLNKWLKNHPNFVKTRPASTVVNVPDAPCGPPPPVDVCEDIPGDQPEGTDCTPPVDCEVTPNDPTCEPPPVDVCEDYPGNQPEGSVCEEPAMLEQHRHWTDKPDCGQNKVTTVYEARYRAHVPTQHGWVLGDWSAWKVEKRESRHTTKKECAPNKTTTHDGPKSPPKTPNVPVTCDGTCLPNTGAPDGWEWLVGAAAALIMFGGLLFGAYRKANAGVDE